MKKVNSQVLIEELQADVRTIILKANRLAHYPADVLNRQPGAGGWTVAQVLEHMNIYARYYIKTIEDRLHRHQTKQQQTFKAGWLGNYFTNMMKPGAGELIGNKMKTFKNAEPSALPDAKAVLQEFLNHQHHLLTLLPIAGAANLSAVRIPISISRFIKLKLGDTLQFFIAHEQRHMIQVMNVLQSVAPGMQHFS